MLTDLTISNIVLIETLSLSMNRGMTALTGETGAGKSILLDSLGLAMGARADSGLLRKGADSGTVTASFDLPKNHTAFQILRDNDFEVNGTDFIIRRTLGADGRSKAFVNDTPISVNLLKDIGAHLVDIHGQFQTHGLLDSKNHGEILDDFGGHVTEIKNVKTAWKIWRAAIKALSDHKAKLEKAKADEEYLIACFEELSKIHPEKGEEDILLEKRQRLQHFEAIISGLNESFQALEADKGGNDSIYRGIRALEKIAPMAEDKIDPLIARMDSALSALRDVAGDIEMMAHGWGDDENIEHVDDRLHELRAMARKHNVLCDQLPDLLDDMRTQLTTIRDDDKAMGRLKSELDMAEKNYFSSAEILSKKRQVSAGVLGDLVMAELPDLKLAKAVFRVAIDTNQTPTGRGFDAITFLIRTNAGSPEGELGRVASGGELSRIMLALKVVLSTSTPVPVMVFDEVDSGIGGSTADAVGNRLSRMSDGAQILVVTHSPQVAAKANHHWIVSKSDGASGTTTNTDVTPILDEVDRIDEIARMVSGATLTDEARAAAKVLRAAA
jgi:DNA repair protein RecN (Recombination protein N)